MAIRPAAVAVSVLISFTGLHVQASAADSPSASPEHDCSDSPLDAVTSLPSPLNRWGQIVCTPFGQMLGSHKGWMWLMPDLDPVFIPAQVLDSDPQPLGNKVYFTKIDVAHVKGAEFDDAYRIFHDGFDDAEVKPDGYRVDMMTVQGRSIRMYFFDYDTYAWGMSCPDNKCDSGTRFMVLDRNTPPKPRQPAI